MPIIKIPTSLRPYTEGNKEIIVEGKNVNEALQSLSAIYPNISKNLYNDAGKLRAFVNIFMGESHINDLQGLETPLTENELLRIIPSIAGG